MKRIITAIIVAMSFGVMAKPHEKDEHKKPVHVASKHESRHEEKHEEKHESRHEEKHRPVPPKLPHCNPVSPY